MFLTPWSFGRNWAHLVVFSGGSRSFSHRSIFIPGQSRRSRVGVDGLDLTSGKIFEFSLADEFLAKKSV